MGGLGDDGKAHAKSCGKDCVLKLYVHEKPDTDSASDCKCARKKKFNRAQQGVPNEGFFCETKKKSETSAGRGARISAHEKKNKAQQGK